MAVTSILIVQKSWGGPNLYPHSELETIPVNVVWHTYSAEPKAHCLPNPTRFPIQVQVSFLWSEASTRWILDVQSSPDYYVRSVQDTDEKW